MAADALMKRNFLLLIVAILLGHFLASSVGTIYLKNFRLYGGFFSLSFDANRYLYGISGSYLFFLFLIFTAFGEGKKYKWIWIAAIPGILIILADFGHFYFHLLFPLAGWLIGFLIAKLVQKSQV